jgi:signal transduction histidine kinase/ligand-binding sensor domain-containing protein
MARRAMAAGGLLVWCGIACALNPSLEINQYAHKAWTIRDGFFKGVIGSIAQTPDGYLWLGTEFGLLRFDGVRSIPWQPPAGEKLPSNHIRSLLAANDGRLWIGTDNGLASWKDGKLAHYPALTGQFVVSLYGDRQGTIWAGGIAPSTGRLCAIRNSSVQCYGEDGSFGNAVTSLYEDNGGTLWVGAATGLWRWKPGPSKLYPMLRTTSAKDPLVEGDQGALLIAMNGGIRRLVDRKVEAYPLPGVGRQFDPTSLLRDRDGGLWIGTLDRGLVHVHHQGRTDSFAQSDGLSSDAIARLFEDREGNIWVATNDGLDRFRDLAVPAISVKQGLSSANVWSVLAARDGSVWLGTGDGLNRWNDGRVTIYLKGSGGLPGGGADSLFEDNRGRIWVCTLRGVAYFENDRFVPIAGVPDGVVRSIAGDQADNLWISHQDQGLFHLLGGRVVERIPWARLGRKDWADALLPDPLHGGLWLGFFRGGVAYLKGGQIRSAYTSADGLGGGRVDDLEFDGEGTLWVATEGGLSRVKNSRVATLTGTSGLPCDEVHWVMRDADRSFWLYTACGLVRVARSELDLWVMDSKRTIQATVFDSSDGVRSRAGSFGYSPDFTKSADGQLWFLPGDGVSVVDPRHLPFNKLPPPVHIEQITADRRTYEASSNRRLPPLTRDLEIEYTALSLVAPEKNRFKYKLEGHDRDWIDAGNRRQAFYNDLPPRNYRFRVVASNNSGVWNEAGDALEFSIAPAYYQTNWFRALIAALVFGAAWGLYRLRLYQIAREFNVRLEERVSERTRLARDLHDTLLQSFHGLMLRFQAVSRLLPDGKAKEQLEQTLERADQAIAEGRSAVYDLRSSTTETNELSEALNAVGNELSKEDAAEFSLVVEGEARDLHPIIRDELYRIAREALSNAFKHAHARHVEAEIEYGERVFRLRIRDDGEGIPAEILEQGRPGHYGLHGIRERARQVSADLTIWSRAYSGTEIDLSLDGSIAYGRPPRQARFQLFRKKVG